MGQKDNSRGSSLNLDFTNMQIYKNPPYDMMQNCHESKISSIKNEDHSYSVDGGD